MCAQPTLVLELNEFNMDLLKLAASKLNLKNIQRIISLNHGVTIADQVQEHQGLDPWVQWVSIHTETPSQEHNILRLGDLAKLDRQQIWERLSDLGISTGVWGVMNAGRRQSPSNQYFVTDPWTFTEAAHPSSLNPFLALPIYFSKNYLDLSFFQILLNSAKTSWFILRNLKLSELFSDTLFLLKGLLGIKKFKTSFLFCSYELISTRIFSKYRKKYKPQVNFIFINSIAHFQHHDWNDGIDFDPVSKFVFQSIDRILSIVLPPENSPEKIMILSGLSQKNVSREQIYCYRQINPEDFLTSLGLSFNKVEQCMTNDAHVFFRTEAERERAFNLLNSATIEGQPTFFVEKCSINNKKLFYQVAISKHLDENAVLKLENQELSFFKKFAIYAKRTGAHIPTGSYLTNYTSLPEVINNSEIFSHIWPLKRVAHECT